MHPELEWIPCPLCGAAPHPHPITVRTGHRVEIATCAPCRIAFQSPRRSAAESAAYMTERWTAADRYVADASAQLRRATKQLRAVQHYVPTPGRLLDVGAGAGAFVAAARAAGWKVEGVEQSPAAVARARVLHGVALQTSLPDERFDVITLWDVIEHVRDPLDLLAALRSRLAPGGRLFLETGNFESWLRLLTRDAWNLYLFDHQYYFTPASLHAMLSQAGFARSEVLRAFSGVHRPRFRDTARWHVSLPRLLATWLQAKIRWPHHGDINIMIAMAQPESTG